MKKIFEMFYDANGKVSMQRVIYFLFATCIMFLWVKFSLTAGTFVTVDVDAILTLVGLGGMKAIQSFAEKK